jgi:precorrin-2 dehydrogenase/sirohydrochlorin ferrochelatase
MTHMPLFIDLRNKKVVIFGGGHVGERKAKLFCNYSKTKVVSKTFTPELKRMASDGEIEIVQDDLTDIRRYLQGAFLVIPATNDPRLNALITDYAKARKVLCNQVDVIGDVVVPSIISNNEITLGISTVGKSPASAKFLKIRIEEILNEFSSMCRLQEEMRFILKRVVSDQRQRKQKLYRVLNDQEVWAGLSRSYEEGLKAALDIVNDKT